MSRMRSRDAKSIPVPTVFLASGAATNAAKSADQRVALKGRKITIAEKKTRRAVKVEDGREEEG